MTAGEALILRTGRGSAMIARRGARLHGLRLDGLDVVQSSQYGPGPEFAAGAVLFPWPNRVRGARWSLDGQEQRLEVTEPSAGNALHGLVLDDHFEVVWRSLSSVQLRTTIDHRPGYPFTLTLDVHYRLVDDGLEVEILVENMGDREAPVAIGAHPYLCVGSQDVSELQFEIPAAQSLLLGPDHLPTDLIAVDGTAFDLRTGRSVGEMPGHAVYRASRPASEGAMIVRRLRGREGEIQLWTDRRLTWTQIYRTAEFPAADGSGTVTALAVEPMSAPPDALSSGVDLEWIVPGMNWAVRWGLRLERT